VPDTILITAADEKYFELLGGLLDSLKAHPGSRQVPVGVIDLGLTPEQIEELAPRVGEIVPGRWDIPFPGCETAPRYRQAFTVTPFLREYFPGHEIYLWIDADVWVQDWTAIEMYLRGARRDGMAAVPEVDRNYPQCTSDLELRIFRKNPLVRGLIQSISTSLYQRLSRLYPRYTSRKLMMRPHINTGAIALMSTAPHWNAWQESYRAARIRSHEDLSDQAALNHAVYTKDLPLHRLPCTCNWLTCFSVPLVDEATGRLVEPSLPHAPIGLLHVVGTTKAEVYEVRTLRGGETHRSRLDYPAFRRLRSAVTASAREDVRPP
jgi:hypothetical protein